MIVCANPITFGMDDVRPTKSRQTRLGGTHPTTHGPARHPGARLGWREVWTWASLRQLAAVCSARLRTAALCSRYFSFSRIADTPAGLSMQTLCMRQKTEASLFALPDVTEPTSICLFRKRPHRHIWVFWGNAASRATLSMAIILVRVTISDQAFSKQSQQCGDSVNTTQLAHTRYNICLTCPLTLLQQQTCTCTPPESILN